ncbi:hypothetical protein EA772_15240 [Pedobacter sp. G11]|uniref:hypothetical protein n=1 Tax=Pedobacter sp. G11 TaxID=2482728 RepID=UPI000F5FC231|nr:hypothetical protein [Pedobacter sp. G11]AZI26630.1 hypothetical protein EA772_15240 [Pedobacter sp. G11]
MACITPAELALVARRLEEIFKNFNITLKVGIPNIIVINLPYEISFKDENAMKAFGYQSLTAAGIRLYSDLELVFIDFAKRETSIILKGIPREDIN